MFRKHASKINEVLKENSSKTNWNELLKDHQTMIKRIQHERIIHLMVTIAVGVVMFVSMLSIIIYQLTILLVFCIPLLLLFIGYVIHYRFLENTTQKWYLQEDQIKKHCKY